MSQAVQLKDPTAITKDQGFVWFDFVGGDVSKILAFTADNRYTLINYNHQNSDYKMQDLSDIPSVGEFPVLESGPYCLSENGEFLIMRVNSISNVVYRVKVEAANEAGVDSFSVNLRYLDHFNSVGEPNNSILYENYEDSSWGAEFLVVDRSLLRIIEINQVNGLVLRTVGQEKLPIKSEGVSERGVDEQEKFGNIVRLDHGEYLMSDQHCFITRVSISLMAEHEARLGNQE